MASGLHLLLEVIVSHNCCESQRKVSHFPSVLKCWHKVFVVDNRTDSQQRFPAVFRKLDGLVLNLSGLVGILQHTYIYIYSI